MIIRTLLLLNTAAYCLCLKTSMTHSCSTLQTGKSHVICVELIFNPSAESLYIKVSYLSLKMVSEAVRLSKKYPETLHKEISTARLTVFGFECDVNFKLQPAFASVICSKIPSLRFYRLYYMLN